MEREIFICSKIRMAGFLLKKGAELIEIRDNVFNPKYKVWVFKNDDKFQMCLDEYHKQIPVDKIPEHIKAN